MNNKVPNWLISICLVSLFLAIGMLTAFLIRHENNTTGFSYEELYFMDDALISGESVIEAIKHFENEKLMIGVKTKMSEEMVIYNWNGIKNVSGYHAAIHENKDSFINKQALFRTSMDKRAGKILSILFVQE